MPEKIIDIRGRKLGGETPLICTPLVGRTRERMLAETASVLGKRPDVIEWRIDYFQGIADTPMVLEVARAMRSAVGDTPIILTRRSIREGGEPIALDDEGVVRLYDAVCADASVDFVDFEMSNDAEHVRRVVAAARKAATRVILSYHNFSYTPAVDLLVQRFLEAERLGGDVGKVAVMPRDGPTSSRCSRRRIEADAQGAHSVDQHVDGAAGIGHADGRRRVRFGAELRSRRRELRTRADPDRRPQRRIRRDPPRTWGLSCRAPPAPGAASRPDSFSSFPAGARPVERSSGTPRAPR